MEAIIRFRNMIDEIDLLFQRCGKGLLFVNDSELEAYFEDYIDKVRAFNVQDMEDELTADIRNLNDNIKAVRFKLRRPVASLNESGYFSDGNELEPMREVLRTANGDKWANDVICGLSAVASWANGLISEVYGMLDEYADNEGEKPGKAEAKEQSQQYKRKINESELLKCFQIAFRGGGNGKIDYFTNNLLPDLEQNWSDKDFAKIALMIYNSGKLMSAMRPSTFRAWYEKFCVLIGCKFHKDYKPSILEPDDNLRRVFYYL